MSSIAKRGTAAALTAVAAAATGVVTNIATNGAAWSWWAALIVLVTVGAALEYYLSRQPDESGQHTVAALGAGSVAVGGSSHASIKTKVHTPSTATPMSPTQGTVALGAGSGRERGCGRSD